MATENLELIIYDIIGDDYYGVSPRDIAWRLRDYTGLRIDVFINSVGGIVTDGMAIYNQLVRHRARVVTHVDGAALSMASVIVQAGNERRMGPGSMMMIHEPWTIVAGDRSDLEGGIKMLDSMSESLQSIYEQATGLPRKTVAAMMAAETWFTAEEAVAQGFADVVADVAAASHVYDLLQGRGFNTAALAALKQPARDRLRAAGQAAGQAADRAAQPGQVHTALTLAATPRPFPTGFAAGSPRPSATKPNDETMADNNEPGRLRTLVARMGKALGMKDEPGDELDVLDEARQAAQARTQLAAAQARVQALETENEQLKAENEHLKSQVEQAEEVSAQTEEEQDAAILEEAVAKYKITRAQLGGEGGFTARMKADRANTRAFLASLPENLVKPDAHVKPPEGGGGKPGGEKKGLNRVAAATKVRA